MTRKASPHPEAGSTGGVNLHGGAYADRQGLQPPASFLTGGVYCIYLRAFSESGTFAAVVPELDRIAALGMAAVWLLPIHPVGERDRKGSVGSPYAIRDYGAIDPAYGTEDDLRRLVDEAHARGLRVIIDFVANHAAPDHVLRETHPEWFAADGEGHPTRRVAGWSDIVDWRFDQNGVTEYLAGSAEHWVNAFGIDGFRCDVAGMVPPVFWAALHQRLHAARADHFMLAEWQDPSLHEIAFHASYDWMLYRALRDTGNEDADAVAVAAALTSWNGNFPGNAIPLRFLENHDEPRVLSWLEPERLPAYAAVAFLSGGLPLLYNGQEVGAVHRPSLFEREPIRWEKHRIAQQGEPGSKESGMADSDTAHGRGRSACADVYMDLLDRRRNMPWGIGHPRLLKTDQPASVVGFLRGGDAEPGAVAAGSGAPAHASTGIVVANLGRDVVEVAVASPGVTPGRFHRVPGPCRPFRTGTSDDLRLPGGTLTLNPGEAWIGESVDAPPSGS